MAIDIGNREQHLIEYKDLSEEQLDNATDINGFPVKLIDYHIKTINKCAEQYGTQTAEQYVLWVTSMSELMAIEKRQNELIFVPNALLERLKEYRHQIGILQNLYDNNMLDKLGNYGFLGKSVYYFNDQHATLTEEGKVVAKAINETLLKQNPRIKDLIEIEGRQR